MITRRLITFILSALISLPLQTLAAPGARTPESMMALVEEFISETRSTQKGPIQLLVGREEYLARAVVSQIAALGPEDFNAFLLLMMQKYINDPKQRPVLFTLLKTIRDSIAVHLANTERMREGPGHAMVTGAYTYIAWILIPYAGVRFAATRFTRGAQALESIRQFELNLTKRPYYNLPYKIASHPLAWHAGAAGLGSLFGLWEHIADTNRTHRLDPLEVLKVIQANLACHLSYSALESEDKFEAMKDDSEAIKKNGKEFLQKIGNIGVEALVLKEQFDRLANLDVQERVFQKTLKLYPQSASWKEFRSALSDADSSQDGQCRQMSVSHLIKELAKMAVAIKSEMEDEETPGADAPKATPDPVPQESLE